MLKIFTINGYSIYFWMNENGEPVHVHVSKGKPSSKATKFWITCSGDVLLCHNRSRIPKADLIKIEDAIRASAKEVIIPLWYSIFGRVSFYC